MNQRILVFASLLVVLAASCTQAQEAKQALKDPPTTSRTAKPDSPVIVRLLGESITEREVLAAIDDLARRSQLPPQQMQQKDTLFFKDVLNNLIGMILLKNESRQRKLTADAAQIEETYKGLVKQFPNEEEFKKALIAQGMTEADLRKNVAENLMYQQVIDQAVKDIPGATDADIKKFYDDNPQYFSTQEQVHAAHILLRLDKNATPEKKAEAKAKLEALRADIMSKKISFADAASKNSEDPGSAKNAGDLGFFPRGQMVKPFDEAAFSIQPGTLSPVIETQFGYHLISVIEHKPAGKTSLEQSKDKIKNFLDGKAKQDAIQKYMADLRQKAKVETVMTEEEWKKRHSPLKN